MALRNGSTSSETLAEKAARHRTPVLIAWTDVPPHLVYVARDKDDAASFIRGWNAKRATLDDGEACTLQDVLDDPESHGLGEEDVQQYRI